ncbi:hypothetical protein BGW38_006889 [Lunasporangiospora selenospora]|uniref:Peroxisomal membrane protein PEX14-like KPWE domain-containing protein n=1 Tax=Lunasporangiospora selenospora TaxID=979761 RepID=A0A9P6G100_9FUNG|nr:hypothetical protein BGW38_006889 [Lunasporangiospora selenospora]
MYQKFDFTLYKEWKARKDGSSDASTSQTLQEESSSKGDDGAVSGSQGSTEPSYPASFQEICELIASGKPIPGIRQIPNELAEGTPSLSAMNPRPKPWEKTAASSE